MKKLLNVISSWYTGLFRVWRREFSLVFGDMGVILFFFALPTLYPLIYTLIYNPEVIRDVPVVVVDNSRSAQSRRLVRMIDATEPIAIAGYAANLGEARKAMYAKECYGILEIPAGYANDLGSGRQGVVDFYSDMSLLLRYRQFTSALTDVQLATATEISNRRLDDLGLPGQNLRQATAPVSTAQSFVGDPSQGFASFVMPGILVLIIQQSLILGVAMIAGKAAERRRRNHGYDPLWIDTAPSAIVIGKTLCHILIYLPILVYILHIVPWIFNLPRYGNIFEALLLMIPMLIASSMLAQILSVFVTERESSFLVIVFTSVIFLFLSGLTWPRYAMGPVWTMISDCIPVTWGVEGFVRINSDNGSLAQQSQPYLMLWLLSGAYFIIAAIIAHFTNRLHRAACR